MIAERGGRVAVIAYHSSPVQEPGSGDAGGMTIYVRDVARSLARWGVATDIFTRSTAETDDVVLLEEGVRVIPIPGGPRAPVDKERLPDHVEGFTTGVLDFVAREDVSYRVVHSHYWQSGLVARSLAAAWDVPWVHSHHTLGKVKNAALAPGDAPEPERRIRGEQSVIDAAGCLVASTEDEYRQLTSLYGADRARTRVIAPGVDHGVFAPGDRSAARERLGLAGKAVLLCVGRIQPLKGIDMAVRATEQLRHALEREPVLLVVGGASGARGEIEVERLGRLARELGVSDNVRFMGAVHHTSLPDLYRAADVTVVCSHSESFGLTALEAHACGCPVVGMPVGGLSHIVHNGRSGFLLDERDESAFAARLKTLLSDSELSEAFGRKASEVSRNFSWDATAAQLLDLYRSLEGEQRVEDLCLS